MAELLKIDIIEGHGTYYYDIPVNYNIGVDCTYLFVGYYSYSKQKITLIMYPDGSSCTIQNDLDEKLNISRDRNTLTITNISHGAYDLAYRITKI